MCDKPNIPLPAVINEYPQRCELKKIPHITHLSIALKVARNIHMRCMLAEAQNWRCCWCGIHCRPEPNYKDSATIEHVQPRSLGGADEWENYAMACAGCNHRRGVLSVEDMLAGRFPKPVEPKAKRLKAKAVEKYIKKALHWNKHGWRKADGSPLCRKEWMNSLRLVQENHYKKVSEVVFGV